VVELLSEKEEKLVVRKATLNLRRKYGRTKQISIVERDAFIPTSIEKEIRESLPKRKSILASDIALRYDLRISIVNLLLRQYEEEGIIKLLDPSLKLKIYVPNS
jgi:ribosomal protein S25